MPAKSIVRILSLFIVGYAFVLAMAAVVFDVNWPGVIGVFSLLLCYALLGSGILLGAFSRRASNVQPGRCLPGQSVDVSFDVLHAVAHMAIAYGWWLLLSHYGGVLVIFASAFDIRESSIGGQTSVVPPAVTYAASSVYAIWVYELARGELVGKMRGLRLLLAFTLILLVDLMSFGRVGLIFALLSAVAWYASRPRRIRRRTIILIACIFAVSLVPRLIRGEFDNFEGSLERYRSSMRMEIPAFLNFAVAMLPYYAGGFFSGGHLLQTVSSDDGLDLGARTLTPIVNAYNRLSGETRLVSIDKVVEVPFEHNVHGIAWDLIRDFGTIGFFPAAFAFGLALGAISRSPGTPLGLATIYFAGAAILFFPVYSLLSFGGFLVSLCTLLILRALSWSFRWT